MKKTSITLHLYLRFIKISFLKGLFFGSFFAMFKACGS